MTDSQRQRGSKEDELSAAEHGRLPEQDAQETGEQDFASRNVIMSNALPGGASPAAGAVIGSGGELGMDPETDEAELAEEGKLPSEERERA